MLGPMTPAQDPVQEAAPTNRNAVVVDRERKLADNRVAAERLLRFIQPAAGTRVLEVGCGGAELSACLAAAGLDCWGLEPFPLYDPAIPAERIVQAKAEAIPHPDASFDLVIAKDLLEHVEDVDAAVAELLRVSRRHVYLMSPNYLFPYEAHFKKPFLPFLPKPLARLWFRCFGCTAAQACFIDHIRYVTKASLLRSLRRAARRRPLLAIIDMQRAKRAVGAGWMARRFERMLNSKIELLVLTGS